MSYPLLHTAISCFPIRLKAKKPTKTGIPKHWHTTNWFTLCVQEYGAATYSDSPPSGWSGKGTHRFAKLCYVGLLSHYIIMLFMLNLFDLCLIGCCVSFWSSCRCELCGEAKALNCLFPFSSGSFIRGIEFLHHTSISAAAGNGESPAEGDKDSDWSQCGPGGQTQPLCSDQPSGETSGRWSQSFIQILKG